MRKNSIFPSRYNNEARPRGYNPPNTYSLLQGITKRTSYNYVQAVKRNKEQPFEEQQRRVLKKLRSRLSRDAYMDFVNALNQQTLLKRVMTLKDLELKLGN
jgi:predicted thioredoxin/glutaredoxin|tara:strand:- start:46 stop:348 length:303 start_codon:yes stop_codon:yes gene_type:complete